MNVKRVHKEAIKLAGVAVRTSNRHEAGPEGKIPGLWGSFFQSGLLQNDRVNGDLIYGLYTDYETDVNGEYTVLLGCENMGGPDSGLPSEHVIREVPASDYLVFTSERGPVGSVVIELWQQVWQYFQSSAESRTYTGDFELYKAEGFDPSDAVVEIYVAVS